MIKNKKVLAITLARGGSKSVPNKNIKNILGKPLIYYTIKEVLKSRYVDDYIISTDSKKIGDVAKKYGAKVPFYRPRPSFFSSYRTGLLILVVQPSLGISWSLELPKKTDR